MASFIQVAKSSIFVSNFFYFIFGLYNFIETNQLIQLRNRYDLCGALNLPIFLYSVAFVLIVLATVVGHFGVLDENPKMIKTYAGMILLCLLFQLSLDFVILKKTGPEVALKVIKYDVIANYNQTDFPYDRDAIERLQQEKSCCGVFSYADYGNITLSEYPSSCCGKYKEGSDDDETATCNLEELKAVKGCGTLFLDMFKGLYNYQFDAIYIAMLVLIYTIQACTLCLSWVLSVKISNRDNSPIQT